MTVTFNRIRIDGGSLISPVPFTIYYKALTDSSWTFVDDNIYVDDDGYIINSPLPQASVSDFGYYVFRAVNDLCGLDYQQNFIVYEDNAFIWVEGTSYCQQGSYIDGVSTITGFADPINIMWDETTGRAYVLDLSPMTSGSNIYWFDPDTITSESDVTPISGLNYNAHVCVMDEANRKIYFAGSNTGGLVIYDIASNSSSVVSYGSDTTPPTYSRVALHKFGDKMFCLSGNSTLTIIDLVSESVDSTIAFTSIPSYGKWFSNGMIIEKVGSEWWVMVHQGNPFNTAESSIGRYNSDFTTLIGTIPLSSQVKWDNNAYWRSKFIIGDTLLVFDMGSSQLMAVNMNTRSVSYIYTFTNRQGKSHCAFLISRDPVDFKLYLSGYLSNSINSDSNPILVTYELDDSTFLPKRVLPSIAYSTGGQLVRKGNSSVTMGASAGVTVYQYLPSPSGPETDGEIHIFDRGAGSNNTGYVEVLTLDKKVVATGNLTGETKINAPGEDGYIAPYLDTDTCAVTYDLECPTAVFTNSTGEYEYSLKPSTASNPAIDHIELRQIDAVSSSLLNTYIIPKSLYQRGVITKVGGNNNRIDLLFKDASNNTLATCTNLFTLT